MVKIMTGGTEELLQKKDEIISQLSKENRENEISKAIADALRQAKVDEEIKVWLGSLQNIVDTINDFYQKHGHDKGF